MRISVILMLFIVFFTACSTEEQQRMLGVLPGSTGAHDEVLVVADDRIWEQEVGDRTVKYLREEYPVLPQPEPTLLHVYSNHDNFNRHFLRFRNVILMGTADSDGQTSTFIKETLGEKQVEKAQVEGFTMSIQRNRWASPQLVCYLLAANTDALNEFLDNHHGRIVQLILDEELPKYRNVVYIKGENKELTENIKNRFGFSMSIPMGYDVIVEEQDFLWLRKDERDASMNLIIHTNASGDGNQGVELRNNLGIRYVSSLSEDSYMSTDTILSVVSQPVRMANMDGYVNRGLWRMINDFKGGPFVQYYLQDEQNDRSILVEGFVFAPGQEKKKMVRQLEAVISTLQVQ